ncbi:MAG TPA: choice-of-anchor J domain-containing protein [Chitinophagaceae bacterium]|nr:choice-of-anchor J domain-containing protein [Chitinophagaceae bacterium]
MGKNFLILSVIFCILSLFTFSCNKTGLFAPQTPAVPNQSFVEEFDTAKAAQSRGWEFLNVSSPLGAGSWQNGGEPIPFFPAYSNHGVYAGFIGTDYTSTSAQQGIISNWLVSPVIWMQNGDRIIFYTRAYNVYNGVNDTTDFGNSLEVRTSPATDSVDAGSGISPGKFTNLLLDINPNLIYSSVIHSDIGAYPTQWTRFIVTVSGIGKPAKGRFAFRYYVSQGGSNGNASGVGIDSVAYQTAGY